MKRLFFIVSLVLCAVFAIAQTDSTAPKPTITYGAFVDAYYTYAFNEPVSGNIDYAYNHSRHNEFNANLALITAKYASDKMRGNLGIQAGTYPLFNYAAEPQVMQHIYDANVGVKLVKNLWLDAGIFGSSHIGFESAISKDNWTLTRSLCAENTPYYATGAELNYEPNEKFLLSLLITNGWQNIRDNNSNKAVGYQVTWKPNKKIGFNASSYFGEAYNGPDSSALMRYFNHAYIYYHPTEKLSFALMADLGIQQTVHDSAYDATWFNPTLLIRFIPNKKWAVCARGEYYDDSKNLVFTATPGAVKFVTTGASLNIDYTGIDNVMLRVEGKYFMSEKEVYTTKSGLSTTSAIISTSIAWWF